MNTNHCKKILIANRSEIALRIQQTCKGLGIKTVAIYSPEDAQSSYVYEADEAYPLSLNGFQAYLNQEEIIAIACQSQADAIHPGYGFLSESPSFAEKVLAAGILWIGPTSATMLLTGDKAQSRALMRMINVPINQGREFKAVGFNLDAAKEYAGLLGYPIMIKDTLGGGGKAMRRVDQETNFDNSWHAVLSEGKRLGFSGNIVIEKYLLDARHVEIQIAGDGTKFIHLYERECSIQRKNQKIIEEAPCRFVSQETLDKMYATSLRVAQSVRYSGVGTVEFLVTPTEEFYFLEVNARLQVEHSVTELTTGIDLVALQIAIISQGTLPITQQSLIRTGHAIECRVYAEDPVNNFLPSTGTINFLSIPRGPFVRVDHDLNEQQEITPFFDAMIAKITVWGLNRPIAITNMQAALHDFALGGVITNKNFLQAVLIDPDYTHGTIFTSWLSNPEIHARLNKASMLPDSAAFSELTAIAAALYQALEHRTSTVTIDDKDKQGLSSWRHAQWK